MIDLIKKNLAAVVETSGVEPEVFATEKDEFGHYSTNVAFKLALILKKSPMEVASDITNKFNSFLKEFKSLQNSGEQMESIFSKVSAVAPGFINFWLKPEFIQKKIALEEYGKPRKTTSLSRGKKINIEFISANPTGPLTMANGRGGFYGDVLANILEVAGNKVTREYYVNDAGNQVRILGESILLELGKAEQKENLYKGAYIKNLAKTLKKYSKKDADFIGRKAADILLKEIKVSLKKAGIKYDVWFSEYKNLRGKKEFDKVLEMLREKGLVVEGEEALFLKTSEISDEKDRVLVKSDGQPTYFLMDLVYHYDKFVKRKFDLAIDIWGADHHGYVARLKSGVKAIGENPEKLKIIITQMVRLMSGGKEIKMSKRSGEFVTMDELIGEVGADATRFFFLMHSLDSHMDFDLDLAKERSQKNPVYYAQYAYVRAINILKKSKGKKSKVKKINLELLNSEAEIRLMLQMIKWPDIFSQTAKDYQVHRLVKYVLELARAFHNFYEKEHVIGASGDEEAVKLYLIERFKEEMENIFKILGINILKKM